MRENAKEVPKIKSYNKKQERFFRFSFFENEFFIFFSEIKSFAPYLCGGVTPPPPMLQQINVS